LEENVILMELIAEGSEPRQRWRHALEHESTYVLGRDRQTDFPVDWDPQVSRRHVRLRVGADYVEVEQLPEATNPVFFSGQAVATCRVHRNEHFVLGATSFHVVGVQSEWSSPSRPVEEVTFNRQELSKVRFRDADRRIEVLSHLPEVIEGARTETEFHSRVVNLLLVGVAQAEAVAIVRLAPGDAVRVLHWDRRRETAGDFRPSSRLVTEALRSRKNSVLHVWESAGSQRQDYTVSAEFDWAFCTPVLETAAEPWGLYVAGSLESVLAGSGTPRYENLHLQADVRFTELVSEIISSVKRVNRLERQQAGLRQFFAPPILAAIGEDLNTDLLEPRECDVTVMFCDLRGFSQKAEEAADDLIGLLDRVSRALGVMTHFILEHGGVTGDFQGDAVLGFWNWPFASDHATLDACRAALGIRAAFAETYRKKDHPLANFQMGIGIAHGRAVAGKIGTSDQVKFTAFGPVVNLASRLESLTRQLRVPILLDEVTANMARKRLNRAEGRTRRLAKILPYGMETPVTVSELLPPESQFPELTDAQIQQYEKAVDYFVEGRWEEAHECLHQIPASDRAQDFLALVIAQHNRTAPPNWDGIVRMPNK
jgi:adenylate cyclase